jgi:hypothetical protein
MRMPATIAILPCLILPACLAPMAGAEMPPATQEIAAMPPAPPAGGNPADDPMIAAPALVTPEMSDRLAFEQAVAAGTSAGLIMFLARNPDSPRAPEIRRLLGLRGSPDSAAATAAAAGADADVVAAFDAARLAGTRAAWDAFLARHGSHPLAAQAVFFAP